jgi:hypothetical protein
VATSLEQCGQVNCLELTDESVAVVGSAGQVSSFEILLGLHLKAAHSLALVEGECEEVADSVSWSVKAYCNQGDQQLVYEGFESETNIIKLLLDSITFDLSDLLAPGLASVRDLEARLERKILGKLLSDWYIKAFLTYKSGAAQSLDITFSSSEEGKGCSFLRFALKPIVHQGQFDPVAVADYRY